MPPLPDSSRGAIDRADGASKRCRWSDERQGQPRDLPLGLSIRGGHRNVSACHPTKSEPPYPPGGMPKLFDGHAAYVCGLIFTHPKPKMGFQSRTRSRYNGGVVVRCACGADIEISEAAITHEAMRLLSHKRKRCGPKPKPIPCPHCGAGCDGRPGLIAHLPGYAQAIAAVHGLDLGDVNEFFAEQGVNSPIPTRWR